MPKRTINIGQPPGNLGNGDTLRDAFDKTNANFDELNTVYPIVDTSLDHDDPTVEGTIAKALEDAGNASSGLIVQGPGTVTCPNITLNVPKNVVIKGVGRATNTIKITGSQDGITLTNREKLTPDNLGDTDVMFPRSLWLSDNKCRIQGPADGYLSIDDGIDTNGLHLIANSENPSIQPKSNSTTALLSLGKANSRGVECLPGIILPVQTASLSDAVDSTVAQCATRVAGPNRGLYQLRDSNWTFIS